MDDASLRSAAAEEGLFLTAVGGQRETQSRHALLDPNKKKLIGTLNLADFPPQQYDEAISGPMRPGCYFYKWLLRGPSLSVRIPDTLIVEKNIVRLIYNDPSTGNVIKAKPLGDSRKSKQKFMLDVIRRFLDAPAVAEGVPSGHGTPKRLSRRVVALLKKPFWRGSVSNETEAILPLPLAAHLMEALDGQEGPYVIQKFVQFRGRRPCIYRTFWRSASASGARTIAVWNVSNNESIVEFGSEPAALVAGKGRNAEAIQAAQEMALIDGKSGPTDNEAFRAEVDEFLKSTSPLERSALIKAGMKAHRAVGRSYLCCLTEGDGLLSDRSCMAVSATRVIGRTAEELEPLLDRLASWIESAVAHKENLCLHLSDLVVDFIRDDNDRWHMIQVKGFRVAASCKSSIAQWLSDKNGGGHDDLPPGILDGPKEDLKALQQKEIREQLEERRGVQCKLCGLSFVEGQTIRVRSTPAASASTTTLPDDQLTKDNWHHHPVNLGEGDQGSVEESDKEVPVFGYRISMPVACTLVELYRDAKFPLTLIAKDILLDYSKVVDLPQSDGPVGVAQEIGGPTAQTTFVPTSSNTNLKKKRSGWILVCYHCFQILQEHQKYQHTSDKLYNALGVNTMSTEAAAAVRPSSANRSLRKKAADRSLHGGITSECVRFGKREPWSRSSFERDCGQYRLLILVHYIADARISPMHASYGLDCCVTYSLGQNSVSLPYKNVLESGDFEEKLIWIKQCRLHYLFSTKRNAYELFQDKEIEFHLFVNRRESMAANGHGKDADHVSSGLQWEGSFRVPLHQLEWLNCHTSEMETLQKIDLLVPIVTNTLGTMVLKLSMAIDFKDYIPWQANECCFVREKKVFWPPSHYNDASPLPVAWLALMTRERSINEFNRRKTVSTQQFFESVKDINLKGAQKLNAFSQEKVPDPPGTKNASREARASIGIQTAASAAAATEKYLSRHMSGGSFQQKEPNAVGMQQDDEPNVTSSAIDVEKFKQISALVPFLGRVFDRQQHLDDGTVNTIKTLHAICDSLNACLADQTLLVGVDREMPLSAELGNEVTIVPAIESLISALRDMMTDDLVSTRLTWVGFVEKLAVYVGVVLNREARESLLQVVESKLISKTAQGADHDRAEELINGSRVIMSTTRGVRVSKALMDISQRLAGTILDIRPNGTGPALPVDVAENPQTSLLPVSRERRYRRLMFVFSMFEDISKRSDVMDAAELKQYLANEREGLSHAILMMHAGLMSVPSVEANFIPELSKPFSLTRGVICSHLLSSSDKLDQLFSRYDTQGVAIISQVGFLRTAEECFETISANRGAVDSVLDSLRDVADTAYGVKYKTRRLGNSRTYQGAVQSPNKLYKELSLKELGLESSPFRGGAGPEDVPRESGVSFKAAAQFVRSVIHSVGVERFETSSPPLIQLCCEVHGYELFFLADLYCTMCERDNHLRGTSGI